ncbi:MAG TPA: cytochrome c-type biogenesis CcmF C-terminal domain-containing protein [Thermoanaerobaculia bacterium]|nr:cytochrome c-type biogenesis CcmF C-terminal domain-containing protein [Thermoanaerobaculia bacterium]
MASITIVLCALLVSIGTSAPLLTGFLKNPGQVGPDFYNRVNLPIAILVALLMAVVPYLTWSGRGGQTLSKKLRWPAAVGIVLTIVAVVFGVRNPVNLTLILFAGTAAASNLQKTIEKGRHGGLKAAGGYLAHVGVAVLLLGVISSAGYGISKRVTLTRGMPQQVGSLKLTFMEYLPRTATQRERMKVAVQQEDGSVFFSYPQLFVNDRTGQLMAHPDVHSELLQDLYVSPIEYDPGQPPGGDQTVQLSKGQSAQVGDYKVAFDGFDLNAQGNALAAMENGGLVTIGAELRLTGKDGKTQHFEPLYHFRGTGQVQAPDLSLPGGGTVAIRGINASKGAVELELTGLAGTTANPGTPATLSLDVSHKPLIGMVWGGLYIILIGGILAIIQRVKTARTADALPADRHPAQSA